MNILTSPKSELVSFDSLFIELSMKACNLKCKHCYIDFRNEKNTKNFIHIDKIKEALFDLKNENIKFIHLTGAEPMLHPDFNSILRLCLKHSSTVIHTNGYSINDKKARFLKKVEEENKKGNELILKLSLEHYDERTNDEIRGRGSYRKCLHSIQSLLKYGFNPIVTVVNHFNEDENSLKMNIKHIFDTINFATDDMNINIVPLIKKNEDCKTEINVSKPYTNLDCSHSRILTQSGVYNCPLTTDDYRGRSGGNFKDYSKIAMLETPSCTYCMNKNRILFGLDCSVL
ncbi:MAG: radical SAM protein [Candidatus Gastranaerophilaceae bacterium]